MGVTASQRQPILPDVPTIAEAALPGFESMGWFGILAPARTPRGVVEKLNAEIQRIIAMPDIQERISHDGSTPKSSTHEAFDKFVRAEIDVRKKVFKAAGVKPD
jgi:tripartite-type tricarboxylate transporter receptor subunit TctC